MTTTTMATTSSITATTKPIEGTVTATSESTTSRGMIIESTTSRAMISESTTSRGMISESTTSRAMISESTTSRAMISESTTSRGMISESTKSRAMINESTTSRAMITPTSVTDPAPQCQPQATSRYPEQWLLVGSKYMVLIPGAVKLHSKLTMCPNYGGAEFPDMKDISFLRPCLTYLLLKSPLKTIRIQKNKYLNVAKNTIESERVPYRVVCLVPREKFVPIKVTEFTLKISTSGRRKLHRDLLAEVNFLRVTIHPTKDTLTLTCAGSGKQEPTVQISNYNSGITTEKGRANHVISKAGCKDSGVYRCHIWNSFMSSQVQRIIDVRYRMKIQSFTIEYTKLSIGGDVQMTCSTDECSSPYLLTLRDDANHTIAGPTDSDLIHKITNIQCSDMGTYFCRGETPNGYIEEKRADLGVYGCPVQVCRGEDKSKVISAVVGQRLNIPVCVMSYPNPNRYRSQNNDVSVDFTRRSRHSDIYYTAHIFHDVTEHNHGNHIIMIENDYGSLNYTITIILQTTTTQIKTTKTAEESTSHQPSTMTTANKEVLATITTTKQIKTTKTAEESTSHQPSTTTTANKEVPATISQTPPPQEKPAHNPPDTDSNIRDIGLTAGIVLVATALIGFLTYCYRMKLLRRSRQLVIDKKAEGRSGQNEIPLLPLARDQTELISGSGYEDISRERPTCPVDLNSPYSHYEEIRDVETDSRERSSAPTKRDSSDIQRDQVEYEIPVIETPKDDNPTPNVQLDDHQPGAPATPISSASKEISQFSNVVEYENTLPAL